MPVTAPATDAAPELIASADAASEPAVHPFSVDRDGSIG